VSQPDFTPGAIVASKGNMEDRLKAAQTLYPHDTVEQDESGDIRVTDATGNVIRHDMPGPYPRHWAEVPRMLVESLPGIGPPLREMANERLPGGSSVGNGEIAKESAISLALGGLLPAALRKSLPLANRGAAAVGRTAAGSAAHEAIAGATPAVLQRMLKALGGKTSSEWLATQAQRSAADLGAKIGGGRANPALAETMESGRAVGVSPGELPASAVGGGGGVPVSMQKNLSSFVNEDAEQVAQQNLAGKTAEYGKNARRTGRQARVSLEKEKRAGFASGASDPEVAALVEQRRGGGNRAEINAELEKMAAEDIAQPSGNIEAATARAKAEGTNLNDYLDKEFLAGQERRTSEANRAAAKAQGKAARAGDGKDTPAMGDVQAAPEPAKGKPMEHLIFGPKEQLDLEMGVRPKEVPMTQQELPLTGEAEQPMHPQERRLLDAGAQLNIKGAEDVLRAHPQLFAKLEKGMRAGRTALPELPNANRPGIPGQQLRMPFQGEMPAGAAPEAAAAGPPMRQEELPFKGDMPPRVDPDLIPQEKAGFNAKYEPGNAQARNIATRGQAASDQRAADAIHSKIAPVLKAGRKASPEQYDAAMNALAGTNVRVKQAMLERALKSSEGSLVIGKLTDAQRQTIGDLLGKDAQTLLGVDRLANQAGKKLPKGAAKAALTPAPKSATAGAVIGGVVGGAPGAAIGYGVHKGAQVAGAGLGKAWRAARASLKGPATLEAAWNNPQAREHLLNILAHGPGDKPGVLARSIRALADIDPTKGSGGALGGAVVRGKQTGARARETMKRSNDTEGD
jgi:hypothetical protein